MSHTVLESVSSVLKENIQDFDVAINTFLQIMSSRETAVIKILVVAVLKKCIFSNLINVCDLNI